MINLASSLLPGQTIGIIGGGQLGQMIALSAKGMGFRVGILDPEEGCPASLVSDFQIVGAYDDTRMLSRLAAQSSVITYEFENVDLSAIMEIEEEIPVPQGSNLLAVTQDRILEKDFLESININIAPYEVINALDDVKQAIDSIGFPCVLKTAKGGYDGKGQVVLYSNSDVSKCIELIDKGPCVLESWIPFTKEISVMVAENAEGQICVFPVVENIHRNNVLYQTIAPARIPSFIEEEAKRIAESIALTLQLRGVLGIEMFLTDAGGIYVNELAPRPHNSGHYSIEACAMSQFEAHVRGICNWPLSTSEPLLSEAVMVNILGEDLADTLEAIPKYPDWHFHYYGKKEARIGRKMGHVTIMSNNIPETLEEIIQSNIWMYR